MTVDFEDFQKISLFNIMLQGLAELTSRLKYGGALRIGGTISVGASEDKTLATNTGKGIIYGGHIKTEPGTDHTTDLLKLYIDEELIEYIQWSTLFDRQIIFPKMGGFWITKYDTTNDYYSCGISSGITFESSLTIKYEEEQDEAIDVYVDLLYAII